MQGRNISLIGLGAMGQSLAQRLMNAGGSVSGYDLSPDAMAEFTRSGGSAGNSVGEAIADTRLTLLFVVNRAQAESVLFAESGVADNAGAEHPSTRCCVAHTLRLRVRRWHWLSARG